MSDLAALRAKYLANAPMQARPVQQSHELFKGVTSSHQRSLKEHWQRMLVSSAVQGSSDVLTDSSASARSSFRQVEPQRDTITAWRHSRSSIGASVVHPAKPMRPRRSQTSHAQLVEERITSFAEPPFPGTSCPADLPDHFMRRSCSGGAAEQDVLQVTLQGSAPGQIVHEQEHKTGRYHSPVSASRSINPTVSHRALPQELGRHSSASGYLHIEQATPPPLGGSWGGDGETCLRSSEEPTRTPLTDCLRDFFAQRAASREQESQEQEAAAKHADLKEQHKGIELSSSSCRIAAAAEARMRTAGALQAAQQVHQSEMGSLGGPAALAACNRRVLACVSDLPSSPSGPQVVQSLGGDAHHSLQRAALSGSTLAPHETCSAAQRIRECYPDIFQPGKSPSFCSAWSSPNRLLPTSCAPQELSMSIHQSTWTEAHESPIDAQRLPASDSVPAAEHFTQALEEATLSHVSPAGTCERQGWEKVPTDEPASISGLSQRAQKLLGRVGLQSVQSRTSVDASVDHWAASKPRDSSVGRISDVLRACGLSDAAMEEILSSQNVDLQA